MFHGKAYEFSKSLFRMCIFYQDLIFDFTIIMFLDLQKTYLVDKSLLI